jgi:polysaccharide chain length determinant protein (PEP-CTERM system associated)
MQDIIDQLMRYYRQVLQRRWLVILVALPVCAAGWAAVTYMPDVHRAETRLTVDSHSFLRSLLEGLAVEDRERQPELIDVARTTLTARTNLERIAREVGTNIDGMSEYDRDQYLQHLARHINVEQEGRPPISQLVIQFDHRDSSKALRAVETMLDILIDSSTGRSREETQRSQAFIEDQIREFEHRLNEAEDRLSQFRRDNAGVMPDEGQTYFSQLQRVRDQVRDIRLDLREARQRRDRLQIQIDEIRAGGSGATNSERIVALQRQLDELRLRFTDNHPDVVSTREQLNSLLQDGGTAVRGGIGQVGDGEEGRVATEFMVEFSRVEADVASLEARLEEFEGRKAELEQAIDTIPAVEAELAKLTRDYESNQRRYQELLQRREAARLSREATATAEETQFRVVDEPRLHGAPVAPRRTILGGAILLFAWGAGAGLALLLGEMRGAFHSSNQLQNATGLPVLGHISKIDRKGDQVIYPLWPILLFGVLTVIAFAILMAFNRGLLALPA